MIPTRTNLRPTMLITALFAVIATIAFNTRAASAQCCNINIRNASDCRFEVCLAIGLNERCVVIHPGGNNFDVPECPNYRFHVHDVCGNTFAMPTVPGESIYVRTSRGCCLRIYLASPCCWEVQNAANCDPCGA